MRNKAFLALLSAGALTLSSCTSTDSSQAIEITGSATVEPITQLLATEHRATVNISSEGTYDGFEQFCSGQSDINNASAAISEEMLAACEENGVEFIELPIALDALSIVVNADNTAIDDLSMQELRLLWEPGSSISSWSDLRDTWPEEEIALHGRPEGSGTFSYFTTQVNGEEGAIRDDYEKTDDLDEMTSAIAEDSQALGFMGVGNYLASPEDHRNNMKTVDIEGVSPSLENAQDGSYEPLVRPLFIYVSIDSLDNNEEVSEFVEYYLENVASAVPRVYFYPLEEETYQAVQQRYDNRVTGTLLDGNPFHHADINTLLLDAQ